MTAIIGDRSEIIGGSRERPFPFERASDSTKGDEGLFHNLFCTDRGRKSGQRSGLGTGKTQTFWCSQIKLAHTISEGKLAGPKERDGGFWVGRVKSGQNTWAGKIEVPRD